MAFPDKQFNPEQVERVAVALFRAESLVGDVQWSEASAGLQNNYRALARQAIDALSEPVSGVRDASDQQGAAE